MLMLGFILLAAAVVLLAVSIRGRVVARGRFCRRCRFDLAGLTDPAACPECGADLSTGKPTVARIRRVSRPMLALSVLLFVGAGVLGALSVRNSIAAISKASDAQVLLLQRFGVTEALTEAAARTTRAEPMSDRHWRTLIRRGLAHQASTATPWDPRWGDVLAQAFIQDRMTEEQVRRFLSHAFVPQVRFRDRVAHDAYLVGYTLAWPRGRIATSAASLPTDANFSLFVRRVGVVGDGTPPREAGAGIRSPLVFHPTGAGDIGSFGTSLRLPRDGPRGETVRVYVETQFTLLDEDGKAVMAADPVVQEATVRILPPGEPVVGLVSDPDAAETIRATATVTPVAIFFPEEADVPPAGEIGKLEIHFGPRPRAVAGRVFIVHEHGELDIGAIRNPAGEGPDGYFLSIRVPRIERVERLALLRRLAERGAVDVVFRTDPAMASEHPGIDEVADLTLRFKDVPVRVVAGRDELYEMVWEDLIPAVPTPEPDAVP